MDQGIGSIRGEIHRVPKRILMKNFVSLFSLYMYLEEQLFPT